MGRSKAGQGYPGARSAQEMGPRPDCRTCTPLEVQGDFGSGGALPRGAWSREVIHLALHLVMPTLPHGE